MPSWCIGFGSSIGWYARPTQAPTFEPSSPHTKRSWYSVPGSVRFRRHRLNDSLIWPRFHDAVVAGRLRSDLAIPS